MPTERLSMRRIRDLLRLKHENGLRKRLGGISKSGDGYILKLLTRGARAAVHRVRIHQVKNAWITELLGSRPFNVATRRAGHGSSARGIRQRDGNWSDCDQRVHQSFWWDLTWPQGIGRTAIPQHRKLFGGIRPFAQRAPRGCAASGGPRDRRSGDAKEWRSPIGVNRTASAAHPAARYGRRPGPCARR